MKMKLVITALLILLLSASVTTKSNAEPWRCHRHGWYGPRAAAVFYPPVPRVYVPAPVVAGGYYRSPYCGPRYHHGYRHRYYGPRGYYR